jgi:hypothetical protein
MASSNHKPLTSPEKALWKDAAVAALRAYVSRRGTQRSSAKHAALAANAADALLDEYRNRIIWRKP